MKCTPQNTMYSASVFAGQFGQLQRIAGQVGVFVDVGTLVVVAEQGDALAEFCLGGADALAGFAVGQGIETVETYGSDLHRGTPCNSL
jgi:hypothetical protein